MNMYRASGKPADSPVSPPERCDQENGTPERWARWSTSTTTQTTSMIATWANTAIPTAVVDSLTPRAVNQIAPTVSTSVSGSQGGRHDV